MVRVKMVWDRELRSFMLVSPTLRLSTKLISHTWHSLYTHRVHEATQPELFTCMYMYSIYERKARLV